MIIDHHYLTVRKWEADFNPIEVKEARIAVWVRVPGLLVEYYEADILFKVARAIGRPIKMDVNTEVTNRAKYARICVEIDLNQPLLAKK